MSEQPAVKKQKVVSERRLLRFIHRIAYQTWNNPIVLKELRGRMRGWRAATVLIIHLTMLGCFASFIYFVVAESTSSSGGAGVGQTMGQTLFYSTYLMLLVLVVFLSPAFTAGAISGERERKTIDLLITTLLPAHSLVLGKLISALAYVVLLIVVFIGIGLIQTVLLIHPMTDAIVESLRLEGEIDFDALQQRAEQGPRHGEGLADAFDLSPI